MSIVVLLSLLCVVSGTLDPTCDSPIYCHGELLKTVQLARIYPDSKTFVDMKMRRSESVTMERFSELMAKTNNTPNKDEVWDFVKQNFEPGNELEPGDLPDWQEFPPIIANLSQLNLKSWAYHLNHIWKNLGRKIKKSVLENIHQYSILPQPNTFIVPGGRFRESYYWDSYWIVSGLLVCDMPKTARGILDNFIWQIKEFGFIPNGARLYYLARSQPPLFTKMVRNYIEKTNNLEWLKENINELDTEVTFWLTQRTITYKNYTLARYYAPSAGPRSESYREDVRTAAGDQHIYNQLKSSAESGWDFSSRWIHNIDLSKDNPLVDLKISDMIPVDLNAFLCGAFKDLAYLHTLLEDTEGAKTWTDLFDQWREAVFNVLYNSTYGVWFDVDMETGIQNTNFYPSNIFPLWTGCITKNKTIKEMGLQSAVYMANTDILSHSGGMPTSLVNSGEQWDFPNAWPNLQGIVVEALANSGEFVAMELAKNMSFRWLLANHLGFVQTQEMFEKYDAEHPGKYGGGGEYTVQSGFGWTNGVIFEILNRYGDQLPVE